MSETPQGTDITAIDLADAALRVNGQIVFSDTHDEIEAQLAAELAEEYAKDAIVAAACDWASAHYPEERGEADARLRAALSRYEAVRTHARPCWFARPEEATP